MKRTLTLLALVSAASVSHASQVASQWYHGSWACLIDGRDARMVWRVENDTRQSCSGGVCSVSHGVKVAGYFSDSGSRWVSLDAPSRAGNDLRFTYTGDNTRWFLRYDPGSRVASGNTVWQGRAYPLVCRKA